MSISFAHSAWGPGGGPRTPPGGHKCVPRPEGPKVQLRTTHSGLRPFVASSSSAPRCRMQEPFSSVTFPPVTRAVIGHTHSGPLPPLPTPTPPLRPDGTEERRETSRDDTRPPSSPDPTTLTLLPEDQTSLVPRSQGLQPSPRSSPIDSEPSLCPALSLTGDRPFFAGPSTVLYRKSVFGPTPVEPIPRGV